MKIIKKTGILTGILAGMIALFSFLMIVQAILPDAWVEQNVVRSLEMLKQETSNVSNGVSLSRYTENIMFKNSITSNN